MPKKMVWSSASRCFSITSRPLWAARDSILRIFIIPEKRGLGYGKAILKHLANIAVERHCGRMEWICLDWNAPSLAFYRSIGAIPMDEWTVQRMHENVVKTFAK